MSPVVAVADLPICQSGRDNRTVNLAGKLLHSGKQRILVDRLRRRLNNSGFGIGFHQLSHPQHGAAVHQAVGIQHNH